MSNLNTKRSCKVSQSSQTRRSFGRLASLCALSLGALCIQFASFAQSDSKTVKPMTKKTTPSAKMKPAKMQSGKTMVMKQSYKGKEIAPQKVVLVFPTDGADSISSQLSDAVTDTVQGRLSASGNYQTVYFLKSLPTIKRALNDSTITPIDATKPFAEKEDKVKTLASLSGYSLSIVSSIDSYTYDKEKNQVGIILSARLVDFSGEKPVVIGAAAISDDSPGGGNAKELTIATELARKLAEKVMTQILSKK